jgi:hypothetical protein
VKSKLTSARLWENFCETNMPRAISDATCSAFATSVPIGTGSDDRERLFGSLSLLWALAVSNLEVGAIGRAEVVELASASAGVSEDPESIILNGVSTADKIFRKIGCIKKTSELGSWDIKTGAWGSL